MAVLQAPVGKLSPAALTPLNFVIFGLSSTLLRAMNYFLKAGNGQPLYPPSEQALSHAQIPFSGTHTTAAQPKGAPHCATTPRHPAVGAAPEQQLS